MNTLSQLLAKITSGRWVQTVAFTFTYCAVILGSLYLVYLEKIKVEVFLGIFAGFTPLVILINEWYFKREDRKNETKEGGTS